MSPLAKYAFLFCFLLNSFGSINNKVHGEITKNGKLNPNNIFDPKVFNRTSNAGIKLFVNSPPVPTKAASQGILGNVG